MSGNSSARALALVLSGAAFIVTTAASAQDWPNKAVRMIVPFGTGGGTDIQARLLAESFRQTTGQPFVTDNRSGAGDTIGAEIVAQAPPDGYTLLFTTASLAVNTTLFSKSLKFDPRKDLMPVSLVSSTPLVLCTHPSVPAKSVKELIALAKKNPGKLNHGVNSPGTTSHLAAELMKQRAGLDTVIIAFKGGGPAAAALMTGEVDMLFATGPVAARNLATGRIKCLAVASPKKATAFPDLPTVASFIPDFAADNWYAIFFPKGTPQEYANKMQAAIKKALGEPNIAKFYKKEGLEPIAGGAAELQQAFERDIGKYAEVIRRANIRVQ